MKKLILFLFIVIPLFAQTIKDIGNSTSSSTTPLDSSEVWTGYRKDVTAYNSVTVSMWSDDTATVEIQFGDLVNTTFTIQKYFFFTYLTNDSTFTRTVPILAPYYRVVVTNSATDSMTIFKVTSMLHKGHSLPTDSSGFVLVHSIGASTESKQDTLETSLNAIETAVEIMDDWDESDRAKVNPIVGQAGVAANRGTAGTTTQRVTIANNDTLSTLNTAIKTSVELLDNSVDGNYLNTNMNVAGTDVAANRGLANAQSIRVAIANDDTTSTLQTAIKTSVELLDNAVDGNYLNINTNFGGADATVNIGNADATTQRVVLASDQPTIPVTLSPIDTVTVKSIVNALPAGDNNIGNVDIVTLPSGNLGQQLSAASLSTTPATNIADATYIGDIKFGESIPSGTAIVGQVGIDQTTPGTTNKVSIGTDGTVAATQSGTWNIGTVTTLTGITNVVHVDDNASSLTVDGTVAVSGVTSSSNSYATTFTTTGTTIDSVAFGFTTKSVTFINDGVITDSLFVSPSSSFTSTNKITRMGGEGFTKYWGVTKLYFKIGTTPLASKKIRVEAN